MTPTSAARRRRPEPPSPPRRLLAACAAAVAASAVFGAGGLAFGFLNLQRGVNARLPFASPVFGGVALALLVGVPFAALAVLAWNGDRRTSETALGCGVGLIGWIGIEVAFVREVSFLQAVFVLVGALFILAARQSGRAVRSRP